ncbi:Rv1733c family protein [Actinacidiphila oryziradicis]|uniref:Uncharacterized protein n=1 Tax=Actinacidiphila oryziradicis TaxID=2571141 RepID=A0A4U0SIA4_9ACTN|nr:hypothetical protein [Actinacidiphila oryziradicis]TKA09454.1 hypothetical protein FCI23_23010 [Actinacidiphila oryziradicis]
MGAKARFWRWRHNPLRRRSDVAEAWVVLTTAVLMAVGVPLAGALSAAGVGHALLSQRQNRHRTSAVLTEDAEHVVSGAYVLARATVRWTASNGTVRTAKTQVTSGSKAGTKTVIWTDGQGRLTDEPPTSGQAYAQSVLAGALAAGSVTVLLLGGREVLRLRLDRDRTAEWEREWAQIGPEWSKRRA